jgi:chaperonin GroES
MNLIPLNDRVVVRRDEEEKTTASGIVLPGSAAAKSHRGAVLDVGPGRLLESGETAKMPVKIGDVIVFGAYSGSNTVKVDGEELLIMSASEILAIVKE